jgi:ATP-dependent RNA helicase HelY
MIYVGSPALAGLGYVVLDEVHYLQDAYRGPVWEEVIIQLPAPVRLVCLSATVSNSAQLAEWITEVRGPTAEIVERRRPVPLDDHFLVHDRGKQGVREFPVLVGQRPNRDVRQFLRGGVRGRGGGRQRPRLSTPRRLEVLEHLRATDRLPLIYFLFSRQGCEDAARTCIDAGLRFTDRREADAIREIAALHTAGLSDDELEVLEYERWLIGLESGIAAHHAGMVPPFKEAVEECFAAGLLSAVFATETLAMGVNLPARSVVIESLTRFRGDGHEFLTPADYTQLTGRAGRRGIDDRGHAFTLWSRYVEFDEVATLVASTDFELRSAFRPTYNMAANLVDGRREDEVTRILEQSFAQFQADRDLVRMAADATRREERLAELEAGYRSRFGDPGAAALVAEISRNDTQVEEAMRVLRPGDVLGAVSTTGHDRLVVVGVGQRRGGAVKVRAVTPDSRTIQLGRRDFASEPVAIGQIELPRPYAPYRPAFQQTTAAQLNELDLPAAPVDDTGTGSREQQQALRELDRARRAVDRLHEGMERRGAALVRMFARIREVLQERGYLHGWDLTERGRLLRRIFHERDLLVAEALHHGLFDGLDAAETAALASTLTYEHRSPAPPPPAWFPSADFAGRFGRLEQLAADLRRDERQRALPETGTPDPGFVPLAHAWTLGLDLSEVLEHEGFSGGDFVRQVRQLVDLLGQIAVVAPVSATRAAARDAIEQLDRGLVAASSHLDEDESGPGSASAHAAAGGGPVDPAAGDAADPRP